jgi:hypothetical protein
MTHELKLFLTVSFLGFVLVWAEPHAMAQTKPEQAPTTPPSSPRVGTPGMPFEIYPQPEVFPLNGTCSMEVTPDKAAIVGGVAVAALKPSDAVQQLETQMGLIRGYVQENHGQLQLMERARTLANPTPGVEDREPPFQVVQRLQAEFPADAAVDAILQKLIELGLDRFGDNVLARGNSIRESVVRFRISGLDGKLKDLEQQCREGAWKHWCASSDAKDSCGPAQPGPDLQVQSFNVQSEEKLLRPEGGAARWQFTYARGQFSPDAPDLLGKIPVHLTGNITLIYRKENKH